MPEYSVYVAVEADEDVDLKVEELGALGDALEVYAAAVSGGGRRYDAQMTVATAGAGEATRAGIAALETAAASVALPPGRVVAVEVVEWEEFERRLEAPNYPELVSAPEVATMLGVSRQRVHQLLAENRSFPRPLYRLGAGPLWLVDAVRAFERRWTRKPGRPRKPDVVLVGESGDAIYVEAKEEGDTIYVDTVDRARHEGGLTTTRHELGRTDRTRHDDEVTVHRTRP